MNKKYFYIFIALIVIMVFGAIIYQSNLKKITNINSPTTTINQDGWTIITDCKNTKLYLWDGKNPSEAGLENEQDILIDYEKKILSVGLPESIYGPRKRLEVSYAKSNDYENCSTDVKRLIKTTLNSHSK